MVTIPVPLPPPDQQDVLATKLNDVLSDFDDGETALARARADLEVYRRSLLKAAVTGELTADWRAANPPQESGADLLARILADRRMSRQADPKSGSKPYVEPLPIDPNKLPRLPSTWSWTSLDAVIAGGIQNGLYLPQSSYGNGWPILRIDDFQSGVARGSSVLRQVSASPEMKASYSLDLGDVVINRVNSPSHLGKSFLVRQLHLPALFESNMMRLRPTSRLLGDYLELVLTSPHGRAFLCQNAKMAVNQASINQGDVRAVPVPLPPLDEQIAVVRGVRDFLTVMHEMELDAYTTSYGLLKQSILAAAFRGELL